MHAQGDVGARAGLVLLGHLRVLDPSVVQDLDVAGVEEVLGDLLGVAGEF